MYERITDRVRKIMQLANQEAMLSRHQYIGTEHILLGLVKERGGVAAVVLKHLEIDPRTIQLEVEKVSQPDSKSIAISKPPQTPRAKNVIEYAIKEAQTLKDDYVGTEHILLGLLREDEGFAAQVLMNLGLRLERVRNEIKDIPKRSEVEGWMRSPIADSQGGPRKLDDETKRHVRQLADALAPLQEAKENAVAAQAFAEAAQFRDRQDRIWKELYSLDLPDWVFRNVKRLANTWSKDFARSLDMYREESGESDPRVLSILPSPLMPPVKIAVGVVPRFCVSTIKAALQPEDIGSPFFEALIPIISSASLARFRENQRKWIAMALTDIERISHDRNVLLCAARPASLSQDVQKELYAGIHGTNCNFVLFEEPNAIQSVLAMLPAETKFLQG